MVEIIKELGLPVGLIAVFLLGGWHIVRWLAKRVVEPLVTGHNKFLDGMEEKARTDSETRRDMIANGEKQTQILNRLVDMGVSHGESLEDLHGKVDSLISRCTARHKVDHPTPEGGK